MIPIQVRSKSNSMEREVRRFAERRIRLALASMRDLRRVHVTIEDVNGPKGGSDKRCRIIARFSFSSIVVEETQAIWRIAVCRAVRRVAQTAARELRRVNRSRSHGKRALSVRHPAPEADAAGTSQAAGTTAETAAGASEASDAAGSASVSGT